MIHNSLFLVIFIIISYLVGSLCSAVVICKLWRLPDPREFGSNNPGATNVKRLGGNVPAFLTLLFDGLKGLIPVLSASFYFTPFYVSIVWLSVIIGHCYSVFLNFRGGKGVATGIGGLIGFNWLLGVMSLIIWLSMIYITKVSALGALIAFLIMPGLVFWLYGFKVALISLLISLIIFWRHKANIQQLL